MVSTDSVLRTLPVACMGEERVQPGEVWSVAWFCVLLQKHGGGGLVSDPRARPANGVEGTRTHS